jgi:hypothetical protein
LANILKFEGIFMRRDYLSELSMVNHQTAEDFYEDGLISEAEMLEADDDCLKPEAITRVGAARQRAMKKAVASSAAFSSPSYTQPVAAYASGGKRQ